MGITNRCQQLVKNKNSQKLNKISILGEKFSLFFEKYTGTIL